MAKTYARAASNVSGADIYNAIVTSTPTLANSGLPFVATDGSTDPRPIGQLFYQNIDLSNAFISSLLNKVVLSLLQSKAYTDPWISLEKGLLEPGDIVEEVFIHMAKPKDFSPARAEQEVFKRELPNVSTAFHKMNYQKYYKRTISREELMNAFTSWGALDQFIANLIQSLYTSAAYDSRQAKMYIIARSLLDGGVATHKITPITDDITARDAVAAARGVSSLMTEMLNRYNYFRLPNFTDYSDQVIIINAMVEGQMDVNVLAAAFNMDKAEFLSMHRLTTPGFGELDRDRLAELFANDDSYIPITDDDVSLLNSIPFAIFDRNWFQIYDKLNLMTNIYNPEGLYWNYDYHVWKILGVSPFSNAVAFVTDNQTVASVTIDQTAVTISPGQKAQLTATVNTSGFASKQVKWTSSNAKVTVSQNGIVSVAADATGTATITATSVADPTKKGTSTVTIA